MSSVDKIIEIDNNKYIKRYLYGKETFEALDNQNKFVKYYLKNNTPWSTLTSDGEAFIGDTIRFSDGYKAKIVSIIKDNSISFDTFTSYSVIVKSLDEKAKNSVLPLNGRASWECRIENLCNRKNTQDSYLF